MRFFARFLNTVVILGTNYEIQLQELQKGVEFFKTVKFTGWEKRFLDGAVVTIKGTIHLFETLRDQYHHPYLKTQNINQDHVERFFGILRDQGGSDRHPAALHMKYRVEKLTISTLLDVSYLQNVWF